MLEILLDAKTRLVALAKDYRTGIKNLTVEAERLRAVSVQRLDGEITQEEYDQALGPIEKGAE